ncbi:hypothetical protein C492_08705 [Natronococcus jeotgali DSM 18795]|uniref:Uncharacterized protein n=1 Tax=Natronococcus jeotgali DSM 18795 TaxID=1227498 RepID=L9XMX1_9EURY|nr:hypothetical protein C492_08705 [Natronococcus jeotgali DSM 18795]
MTLRDVVLFVSQPLGDVHEVLTPSGWIHFSPRFEGFTGGFDCGSDIGLVSTRNMGYWLIRCGVFYGGLFSGRWRLSTD